MKKLLIDVLSGYIRAALLINGELCEFAAEDRNDEPQAGDIFSGRVMQIVKKQYAFVDIGAEKNGFLQLNGRNIQQGQSLVVQVEKPAYDEKGAALTTDISISGRFAAVTTDKNGIGISRKITDDALRQHLKEVVSSALTDGFNAVVRTNAAEADENDIVSEISEIQKFLSDILTKGQFAKPPYCLYRAPREVHRLVRDCLDEADELIVNDEEYFNDVSRIFKNTALYTADMPLFMEYGIESAIEKLLQRKVWLDCGGFLIFDYTEAMTVIDVNSGKFTDGGDKRKTALKVNIQAAKEIARQLRLRNLSGIIIVDFVNMKNKEDIQLLEDELKKAISSDRLKTVYIGMTELGLGQLTRQKQSVPLHKLFSRPCQNCKGSGITPNFRYISGLIKNKVIYILSQTVFDTAVIKAGRELANYLEHSSDLEETARKYAKNIKIEIIPTAAADYFEVGHK
ncbi:MAG: ribonuclease E/G [Firmicutes bacterium]|nr:ribonuclease E/G [Bacillota bacterium]